MAPGPSLTGVRLIFLITPWGFPCCVRFPCVHAVATTPAQRLGILFARFHNRISLPRKGRPVGLRNDLFEACSAFTHITAYTLAGSPKATPYIGGFSYFVTSIAAPIASGRSDLAGWDFHPLEKRRLITAHTRKSHSLHISKWQQTNSKRTVGSNKPTGDRPIANIRSYSLCVVCMFKKREKILEYQGNSYF